MTVKVLGTYLSGPVHGQTIPIKDIENFPEYIEINKYCSARSKFVHIYLYKKFVVVIPDTQIKLIMYIYQK